MSAIDTQLGSATWLSGGGSGGTPLLIESAFEASGVTITRAWTTVGTVTIPQASLVDGATYVILFDGTADRTVGNATISIRLRSGATVLRSETDEVEVSGSAEHEQVVMFATDTPPADADAVYVIEAQYEGGDNFRGTIHAREMLILGGTVTGSGGGGLDRDAVNALITEALVSVRSSISTNSGGITALQTTVGTVRSGLASLEGRYDKFIDFRRVQVANAAGYTSAITAHVSSGRAMWIVSTAAFTATISGATHNVSAGDVIYFAPGLSTPLRLFTLPNGITAASSAVDSTKRYLAAELRSGNVVQFWDVPNEVPDTPGDSTGVGHVLTVTGENDRDYAWRAAAEGVSEVASDGTLTGDGTSGDPLKVAAPITADGSSIDTNERYLATILRSGGPIQYWDRSRQIPISGRTGDVLTKTGSNDTDYEFRTPASSEIEDDTITPAKLLADEACLLYTSPSPRDS